ncbi:hypothetical protein [uncultured Nostoc sp.]|uniref:hypothetical protein n=1 Tax=uncultured Nostoc sp. TaxID=340711 RepID=UPI0035CAE4C4
MLQILRNVLDGANLKFCLLTEGDRSDLQTLMQVYQEGLLRKATALSEAVKRGLIEPLS